MDRFTSVFHRSFMITAAVAMVVGLLLSAACATTPQGALVEQVAVQYATGKLIEAKPVNERAARAAEVLRIASTIQTLASGDTATVDELEAHVDAILANVAMSPSDRLLASTVVSAVVAALKDRVSDGVLSPDDRLVVTKVLGWAIQAAQGYAT